MTKFSKLKNYFVTLLIVFGVFFITVPVFAAELYFEPVSQKVNVGEQFEAGVFLNTENEEINAMEGKIMLPENLLEVKEIRDGNSIINFWIDPVRNCVSNGVERPGSICFAGITPGGYVGEKGLIFSVVFQAKKEGEGEIEVIEAKTLLNDGKGTPADLSIFKFQFSISKDVSGFNFQVPEDFDLPEEFKPEIAQSPGMFEGKYFLVFATQDKGSGIERYEIQETRNKRQGKNWVEAESPYVLKDQNLKSYIYVKAIDKAGNERIVVIEPRFPMKWYDIYWVWGIIILGVFVLYIGGKILWQKFIKSR